LRCILNFFKLMSSLLFSYAIFKVLYALTPFVQALAKNKWR